MTQYLIEITHDPEACIEALEKIEPYASDLLDEIYWGCASGKHTGRILVEAESESQAREMIPESMRGSADIREADAVNPELVDAMDPEAASPGSSDPSAS